MISDKSPEDTWCEGSAAGLSDAAPLQQGEDISTRTHGSLLRICSCANDQQEQQIKNKDFLTVTSPFRKVSSELFLKGFSNPSSITVKLL